MGSFADQAFARARRRLTAGVIAGLSIAALGGAATTLPVAAAPGGSRPAAAAHHPRFDSGGLQAMRTPGLPSRSGQPQLAPRTAPGCDSTFHQVPGVNPGSWNNSIQNNALAAVSPTDIWGVGAFNNNDGTANGSPNQTLVERWDGSNWSQVSSPDRFPGNDTQLWGVTVVPGATTDANNVWAVGHAYDGPTTTGVAHTVAMQYTSTGFNIVTTPDVGLGNNRLTAVTALAANDIWAVGSSHPDNNTAHNAQPLIEHYNGTAWSVVSSPQAPQGNGAFFAVSASSPTDIWAVGAQGYPPNTLIEHYDGTAWSVVSSPSVPGGALYSVAALTTTAAWAAGYATDAAGNAYTLIEQWNGTSWNLVSSPNVSPGIRDNYLFSLSALSTSNIWAAGDVYAPGGNSTTSDTLVEHWDGSKWSIVPSVNGQTNSFNEINAILATSASNIWGAGDYVNGPQDVTLFENLCVGLPTVSGVAPVSGNDSGSNSVVITGTNFQLASGVNFGATSSPGFTIDSNTQITATAPAGTVGTVDVTVTNPAGTSATSPADTYVYVPPAISWRQYTLAGSDGSLWKPIDAANLSLTMSPAVASNAILSGNADLWTSLAGVNQDLGIMVSGGSYGTGTVVGWKESGGYAGTFSPNAAFVQAVIPLATGNTYTAQLVWKSNKSTSGTIFIAAGSGPAFSPTRLTAELVPSPSPTVLQSIASTKQYTMTGNNGSTWKDIDAAAGLTIASFTPATTGPAMISANVDLWTTLAGVNQDVGILASGGSFGAGQIIGWKESGGYAGTFSPNAAYAQAVVQLTGGTAYSFKMQWKTNNPTSGTIVAGAGSGPQYSQTRLTARVLTGTAQLIDSVATTQFHRTGSSGSDWQPVATPGVLQLAVSPATASNWVLSANADLWTATTGVNQDLGIFVSGGAFGTGTLVAWKESGGYAGTFSPNAAFLQTVIPLAGGTTYTVTLEWKANKATSGTIYAAAGGGSAGFSPTRVTAQQLN